MVLVLRVVEIGYGACPEGRGSGNTMLPPP